MPLAIRIHLLNGGQAASDVEVLPVVVEISSDEPVLIAEKIDLLDVWLDAADGSDLAYGYSAAGRIGILGDELRLSPRRSKYLCVDILECEEEKEGVRPGKYRLTIKICVYVKRGDEFKPEVLTAESTYEITGVPNGAAFRKN